MHFFLFLPYYLKWHYGKGTSDLVFNLKNGFLFIPRFFSLSVLFRTLLSPWKRLGEEYHKGFDPGAFFSTIILNSLLRALGLVIRSLTILVGVIFWFIFALFATLAFFIWILFPFVLLFILALALKNIF